MQTILDQLEAHIPRDLARIAFLYLLNENDDFVAGFIGHYEKCNRIRRADDGLYGACEGGNFEVAKLMISRGAAIWNVGLYHACKGGHLDLVMLMISHGARAWNLGLSGACQGNRTSIVKQMIEFGANDLGYVLHWACKHGNIDLQRLAVAAGAIYCDHCGNPAGCHVRAPAQKRDRSSAGLCGTVKRFVYKQAYNACIRRVS